jgi:tetratricopeptide (TPR) repeat protein
LGPGARAAEQGQLDGSLGVFSVLAAINAAGYDAEIDSPTNSPVRAELRQELAQRKIPVLEELRDFYRDHKQDDPAADLTQYIFWALTMTDPPEFKVRHSQAALPPAAAGLVGFDRLMRRFHQEAGIDELWKRYRPAYDEVIARYHEPVTNAVLETSAYLRNTTSGVLGGRFQVYVDLLGAPNQIHTLSYSSEYFVVITPSAEVRARDVRHGYLHYLLEPLATRFAEHIDKKKALEDFALGAPALDDAFKKDFLLLVSESLIKAVEARLAPVADREKLTRQAMEEGFVLAGYFSEALPVYEKQEASMRLYYAEMIDAIDPKKETVRLDKVQFVQTRAKRMVKVARQPVQLTGPPKLLEDAENAYDKRELEAAKSGYQKVLEQSEDARLQARAYYGLARIAAMQKNPELSERLFEKTLELNPPVEIASWSHIFLARLAGAAGEREEANQHFRSVLVLKGISPRARQAAEEGIRDTAPKGKQ